MLGAGPDVGSHGLEVTVCADAGAMDLRQLPGQDRGHRRQGPRGLAERMAVAFPFGGESVQVGRGRSSVPVGAEVIGPQRIDHDDDDPVVPRHRAVVTSERGREAARRQDDRSEANTDAGFAVSSDVLRSVGVHVRLC